MYALLTGSPSYPSLSSLMVKLANSSETWQNKLPFIVISLYLFYLSLISVSLQSALYRSLLTHITALHPPPSPLSVTLTDADTASAHLHS
jgi:hypothetical protein